MKNQIFSLLILLSVVFFSSCSNSEGKNNENQNDSTNTSVQKTECQQIAIADFDKKAEKFLGQEVKIEGTVGHICSHSGKKMFLFTAPNEDISIKITSEETFNQELMGTDVSVIGKVAEERITEEEVAEMEKEAAGETCEHEGTMEIVNEYKKTMEETGKNYVSFYYVEFEKFEE